MALNGTAHQVEQRVRNYRYCQRLKPLNEEIRHHALREPSCQLDDGWGL